MAAPLTDKQATSEQCMCLSLERERAKPTLKRSELSRWQRQLDSPPGRAVMHRQQCTCLPAIEIVLAATMQTSKPPAVSTVLKFFGVDVGRLIGGSEPLVAWQGNSICVVQNL